MTVSLRLSEAPLANLRAQQCGPGRRRTRAQSRNMPSVSKSESDCCLPVLFSSIFIAIFILFIICIFYFFCNYLPPFLTLLYFSFFLNPLSFIFRLNDRLLITPSWWPLPTAVTDQLARVTVTAAAYILVATADRRHLHLMPTLTAAAASSYRTVLRSLSAHIFR